MGNVKLSSNEPTSRHINVSTVKRRFAEYTSPKASATPLINPATKPMILRPDQPASVPVSFTPWSKLHTNSFPPNLRGAIQDQKVIAMNVPVRLAAKNPAKLFRGASGSRRLERRGREDRGGGSRGIEEGSRGEEGPYTRPTVDAAVSAQERLCVY
jgi:hypothetical protein